MSNNILILKKPKFEDDSFLLRIKNINKIKSNILYNVSELDKEYYEIKKYMFKNKETSKIFLKKFYNRPSLRFFKNIKELTGTIYTKKIELENSILYEDLITLIRENLKNAVGSRRNVIRLTDDYIKMSDSINSKIIDVSCLQFIQYFNKKVNFMFRASDIKNELLLDILLLFDFFIYPIYKEQNIEIEIYASTSQKIDHFNKTIKKMKNKYEK
ncbi:hypothetical protein K9M42_02605 [Patescibacteria group bacterium]|nr:hypothetical protein [Patescibacteria group bacterium]